MPTIPTEPIGSIPRPPELLSAVAATGGDDRALDPLYDRAIRDTIEQFEATGSPVITDGEQRKYHNFWTYCVHGLPNTAPNGFKIPFAAGHVRRMPRLTGGAVPVPNLCHGRYNFRTRENYDLFPLNENQRRIHFGRSYGATMRGIYYFNTRPVVIRAGK